MGSNFPPNITFALPNDPHAPVVSVPTTPAQVPSVSQLQAAAQATRQAIPLRQFIIDSVSGGRGLANTEQTLLGAWNQYARAGNPERDFTNLRSAVSVMLENNRYDPNTVGRAFFNIVRNYGGRDLLTSNFRFSTVGNGALPDMAGMSRQLQSAGVPSRVINEGLSELGFDLNTVRQISDRAARELATLEQNAAAAVQNYTPVVGTGGVFTPAEAQRATGQISMAPGQVASYVAPQEEQTLIAEVPQALRRGAVASVAPRVVTQAEGIAAQAMRTEAPAANTVTPLVNQGVQTLRRNPGVAAPVLVALGRGGAGLALGAAVTQVAYEVQRDNSPGGRIAREIGAPIFVGPVATRLVDPLTVGVPVGTGVILAAVTKDPAIVMGYALGFAGVTALHH